MSEVSPHAAACTVTLVDWLVHRSEVSEIEGDSYRLKEAKERAALKTASRRGVASATATWAQRVCAPQLVSAALAQRRAQQGMF